MEYSIIIPAYNEKDSILILLEKIKSIFLNNTNLENFEIIFIDDGSTDNTYLIAKEWFIKEELNYSLINFRVNRGKSYALDAGFKESSGDIVLTIDADLQDEPDELFNLINKLKNNYDLVSGWKRNRNDPLNKTLPSLFFNKFTSFISGVKIHDFNCGLKAYRKDVVKDINLYGELHRYIPLLAAWRGFRIAEVPVKHHRRKYGYSKYGIERYLRGFLDLVTIIFLNKYLKRPLHLFGSIGIILLFFGVLIESYLTILWFLGDPIGSRPLLFFGILLIISGLQSFFFGLLGDMLASTNFKNPPYKIEKHKNLR